MGFGESLAPFGGLLPAHLVLVHRLCSATRPGERKIAGRLCLAQSENYGFVASPLGNTDHPLALRNIDHASSEGTAGRSSKTDVFATTLTVQP
jgi:hypothetical protein